MSPHYPHGSWQVIILPTAPQILEWEPMVDVVHRKPITVDRQRSFRLLIAAESPLVFSYSFQETVTGNEAHGTESSNFIMNNIFLNGILLNQQERAILKPSTVLTTKLGSCISK